MKYWREPPPVSPQRRIQFRYVQAPNLPIWLDDDTTGTLASLTVGRGQGTKLYRITREQMDALVRLAGGWDTAGSSHNAASPAVRLVATAAEVAMVSLGAWPDEVEEQQVAEEVADAADAATAKRRGRGYSADPAFRSAVELNAMKVAETYLRGQGLSPKNTAATHPYDFECEGAPHHSFGGARLKFAEMADQVALASTTRGHAPHALRRDRPGGHAGGHAP